MIDWGVFCLETLGLTDVTTQRLFLASSMGAKNCKVMESKKAEFYTLRLTGIYCNQFSPF